MECYEGATMIKTFRGKMEPDTIDTIVLHTNDGSTGYRIVKFEAISNAPAGNSPEAVIQIWKIAQTATSYNIDFSNQALLGSIFYENNNTVNYFGGVTIIFDHEIFNQDIYVTCASTDGAMNYYIELEQVKLDINANTVATLKDMRNTASPRP